MFLQSSVSGLKQLFSTAPSPHTPRGQRQLESVTEEAHTYDLLYPECETLRQGQHYVYPLRQGDPSSAAAVASSSDDRGGLDIQSPRDVRIIIAQDANALSSHHRVLYDSHPPPPIPQARNATFPEASKSGHRKGSSFAGGKSNDNVKESHTAPHTRQSSFSQTAQSIFTSPTSPLPPVSEVGGLFSNAGRRNSTLRPATSDGETAQSKIAREGREETEALLDCMFGATGFPSISSTKLHIGPPKALDAESDKRPNSAARDMSFSGAFPKRRTPLTRSTTAADLQSLSTTAESRDADLQPPRPTSSSMLITRLFSIDPTESAHPNQGPDEPAKFFRGQSRHESDQSRTKAKQLKTPTYAVAVLLQMPTHRQRPSTPSMQHFPPQRSNLMGYAAINTQSWPLEGAQVDGITFDSNRDIEYVIAHWTILIRVLKSLEIVARCKISDALVKQELPYLDSLFAEQSKTPDPGSGTKPNMLRPQMQRTLQLPAGALQQCSIVQNFTESVGIRIALALKTRRVIAGQPRWGIWREEARLVGACLGGRDQNFFLFNLLTAFLGSHTEWLESLGPSRYRRRHAKQSNDVNGEVSAIQHRTVIVSQDKMTARRLIFLLSAFLPGIQRKLTADGLNHLASDASWSNVSYSQSPPSGVLMQRRQSLRRTMNRKNGESRAAVSFTPHARSVSLSGSDVAQGDDAATEGLSIQHRSRRTSDTRSIRSVALPISSNASVTRKSSITTTATVIPEPVIPVINPLVIPATHFSNQSTDFRSGIAAEPKPETCGNFASLSLRRTLSRSESNEHGNVSSDSQSGSRWGSMISGFWSGRRASSTEDSDVLASSEEGLGISGVSNELRGQQSTSKLAQMVQEVDMNDKVQRSLQSNTATPPSPASVKHLQFTSQAVDEASPPKIVSDRLGIDRFPLKLSIDEDDGVVDVDLPPNFPYSSSFASITSSPVAVPTAGSSFNDRQSLYGRSSVYDSPHKGTESAVDVVGWLRRYHQDFALQAVRPYDTLKEDVKRSMRTEPTSATSNPPTSELGDAASEWTEICTTLIADTTNFTVTRLCLRRKNATSPHHQADALLESSTTGNASEEEMTEEPIMDMDPTLIDAVERVLAQSGKSSRAVSRPPSPSRHTPTECSSHGLEIPRSECKRMVLGALEQVAKSVSAELSSQSRVDKNAGKSNRGRENLPTDSTLREGVRKWLNEVGREGA